MKKNLIAIFCLLITNLLLAQTKVEEVISSYTTISTEVTYDALRITPTGTLVIQPGGVVTVTGTLTNEGNQDNLIIEYGGQLINGNNDGGTDQHNNGTANVSATFIKQIDPFVSKEWYAVAMPFVATTINTNLIETDTTTYDLYYYKEDDKTKQWQSYDKNTFSFSFGRGYLYANTQLDKTITINGELNYETEIYIQNVTCSSGPGYNSSIKGWNLIGNPYPHNIYKGYHDEGRLCGIANENLCYGYYTLNGEGRWQAHTCSDAIKPGDAILVRLKSKINQPSDHKNELKVTKSNYVATSETSNYAPTKDINANRLLEILVEGNNSEDKAFIYFDGGSGLEKFEDFVETTSLSVRYEDERYAIACLEPECRTVDVLFDNNQMGFYTLTVNRKKGEFKYLHLIDNFTGDEIDLLKEENYKFYAFGNETANRFKLVLNSNTTTTNDNVFAYVSNGDIIITGLENTATLQVFDVMGRLVGSDVITKAEGVACRTSKPSVTGVYVLRLISENGIKTQKIVVE